MFSVIVSSLFEILALSVFKGMHLVLCDTFFLIRVLCNIQDLCFCDIIFYIV